MTGPDAIRRPYLPRARQPTAQRGPGPLPAGGGVPRMTCICEELGAARPRAFGPLPENLADQGDTPPAPPPPVPVYAGSASDGAALGCQHQSKPSFSVRNSADYREQRAPRHVRNAGRDPKQGRRVRGKGGRAVWAGVWCLSAFVSVCQTACQRPSPFFLRFVRIVSVVSVSG